MGHRDVPASRIVERRRRRFTHNSEVRCERANLFYGVLSRQGLDHIKLAYNPYRPDGRLKLTASTYSRLKQYISSPKRMTHYCEEPAICSSLVAETITGTHCTYPRRDGQAEWA